jgi:hypothetical protein
VPADRPCQPVSPAGPGRGGESAGRPRGCVGEVEGILNGGAATAFLPHFGGVPSPRGLHSSTVQLRRPRGTLRGHVRTRAGPCSPDGLGLAARALRGGGRPPESSPGGRLCVEARLPRVSCLPRIRHRHRRTSHRRRRSRPRRRNRRTTSCRRTTTSGRRRRSGPSDPRGGCGGPRVPPRRSRRRPRFRPTSCCRCRTWRTRPIPAADPRPGRGACGSTGPPPRRTRRRRTPG